MIKFLFKGLIRDRSKSLFPIAIVVVGVAITVLLYSWINGVESDMTRSHANFNSGHLKIMSRAYAEEADQVPNDLAYIGIERLLAELKRDFPGLDWTPRVRFGGLLDIPDGQGETRSQGPVMGLAVDLLSSQGPEKGILNLANAVARGRLPEKPGEIMVSDDFARRLDIHLGEKATLISSTMYGSIASANFILVGTVRFGVSAMDRGAMLADISDIQNALDMNDAAGEILGFFSDHLYHDKKADEIAAAFNAKYRKEDDEFSPEMATLRNQAGMAEMLNYISSLSSLLTGIFVLAMSLVLWNAGLTSNLRRYGEIGVRLAIGESKGHIYRSMIAESLMIGSVGSVLGTGLGLAVSYYFQVKGFNIASLIKNASMMVSDVMRAQVTPVSFFIGVFPGILATLLGAIFAGIGIYKRQTSQLFKELEV